MIYNIQLFVISFEIRNVQGQIFFENKSIFFTDFLGPKTEAKFCVNGSFLKKKYFFTQNPTLF